MAVNRRAVAKPGTDKTGHDGAGRDNGTVRADAPGAAGDDMNGAVAISQQSLDWIGQLQRTFMQSTMEWNQALTQAMLGLQDANNPLQLMSLESGVFNRQLEALATQTAGLMQLLFDSQLFVSGLLFKKPEAAQMRMAAPDDTTAMLKAWGNAQDDWLKMTRSWMDAANAVNPQPTISQNCR